MAAIPDSLLRARRAEAFRRRGRSITYRRNTPDTPNFATGVIDNTETDTTVTVMTWLLSNEIVTQSNGRYTFGDRVFHFLKTTVPSYPPRLSDRIILGTDVYTVVGSEESEDLQAVDVIARLV